jgi:hypothetical protein
VLGIPLAQQVGNEFGPSPVFAILTSAAMKSCQVFFVVIPIGAFDGFFEQSGQAHLVWGDSLGSAVGQCAQLLFRKNLADRLGASDLVIDGEVVVRRGGGAPGGQKRSVSRAISNGFFGVLMRNCIDQVIIYPAAKAAPVA